MLKAIAEFQVIERVNNEDTGIVVDIFDKKDKIKVIEIADDKRVTVYYGTAKNFLNKLRWAHQFLDSKKLEKFKNWRK